MFIPVSNKCRRHEYNGDYHFSAKPEFAPVYRHLITQLETLTVTFVTFGNAYMLIVPLGTPINAPRSIGMEVPDLNVIVKIMSATAV